MAKSKNKTEKKKNVFFIITSVILCAVILASLIMLARMPSVRGDPARKINESIYPLKYEDYVEKYAREFDVDVCLVFGVIKTESGFNPEAVSSAGAIGLMQLMPDTFTWLQNYRTEFMPDEILPSSELYKPQVNIEYGTYLLRFLLDRYDGNTSLAIIAYNAGYGNVDNWLSSGTVTRDSVTSDQIPFPETANYLDRVTNAMEMYRSLYYSDTDFLTPPDSESDSEASEEASSSEAEVYSESEYVEEPYYYEENTDEYYYENEPFAYEGDGTGLGYDYGGEEQYYDENYGEW